METTAVFKKLTNLERKQYIANVIHQSSSGEHRARSRITHNIIHCELNLESRSSCFDWSETPQRHEYWHQIKLRLLGINF